MNEVTTIPRSNELVRAVATVMRSVHRLAKAENNEFAKYQFTSVDDFKDHLRPLLGANGLGVRMTELECETFEAIGKNNAKALLARFTFGIQLVHESGAEEPQERTTVILPYAAAQTTGQARSYALKEWLKAKFLASSGDVTEDVDSQPTGEYRSTLPKKDARPVYAKLEKALDEIERDPDSTVAQLQKWWVGNKSDIDPLPEDWKAPLRERYQTVLYTLKARPALGNGNGRFAKEEHQQSFDAQKPAHDPDTGEVPKEDANADWWNNYDARIADYEDRLKAASDDGATELFDTEIRPKVDDQMIMPVDADRLKRLLKVRV